MQTFWWHVRLVGALNFFWTAYNWILPLRTVRRVLHKSGYLTYQAQIKKISTKTLKTLRMKWAASFIEKSIGFWGNVVFFNEKRFYLVGLDRHYSYLQHVNDTSRVVQRRQRGRNFEMVWAFFAYNAPGSQVFITETQSSASYCVLLGKHLLS